jgi:hypothetical protein
MSADQFFDGGWCWMAHPEYNVGNPIPVFMSGIDGERWFYPLDPSNAEECDWDRRDDMWEMVSQPHADPAFDTELELFAARVQVRKLTSLVGELIASRERWLAAIRQARDALDALYRHNAVTRGLVVLVFGITHTRIDSAISALDAAIQASAATGKE